MRSALARAATYGAAVLAAVSCVWSLGVVIGGFGGESGTQVAEVMAPPPAVAPPGDTVDPAPPTGPVPAPPSGPLPQGAAPPVMTGTGRGIGAPFGVPDGGPEPTATPPVPGSDNPENPSVPTKSPAPSIPPAPPGTSPAPAPPDPTTSPVPVPPGPPPPPAPAPLCAPNDLVTSLVCTVLTIVAGG